MISPRSATFVFDQLTKEDAIDGWMDGLID